MLKIGFFYITDDDISFFFAGKNNHIKLVPATPPKTVSFQNARRIKYIRGSDVESLASEVRLLKYDNE